LAIIGSVVSSAIIVLGARRPLSELDTWVRTILPFASVAGVSTLVALVGILPPAALIAWLTARRTTRRLQSLMEASAALRDGETATRIEVDGEDEVAQLQEDFNAMAASLDRTLAALQAERDKVAALLEARRQLIAGVSHELRTPLATLRGYLESIQQAPEAGALEHDLTIMDGELSRLQVLIDDLFTLSKAEVNGLALELAPVDLGDVVTQRVDAAAPLAWQRDRVRVIAELPPDLPSARADAIRVEQILVNLLRNALRHTPPGGIVAVSLTVMAGEIRLSVCDTGEGIPQEDLPHIWRRFYRGANARLRDAHGAGLGLALVKELAEAMEGRVAVESDSDQGACFHVWFQRANPSQSSRPSTACLS
jgi:signal transduction histidine kinase